MPEEKTTPTNKPIAVFTVESKPGDTIGMTTANGITIAAAWTEFMVWAHDRKPASIMHISEVHDDGFGGFNIAIITDLTV